MLNKIDLLSLPLFFSRLCNIDCIIRRKIGPRRRLMLIKRGNFVRISRFNLFYPAIRITYIFFFSLFIDQGIIDLSLLYRILSKNKKKTHNSNKEDLDIHMYHSTISIISRERRDSVGPLRMRYIYFLLRLFPSN